MGDKVEIKVNDQVYSFSKEEKECIDTFLNGGGPVKSGPSLLQQLKDQARKRPPSPPEDRILKEGAMPRKPRGSK